MKEVLDMLFTKVKEYSLRDWHVFPVHSDGQLHVNASPKSIHVPPLAHVELSH